MYLVVRVITYDSRSGSSGYKPVLTPIHSRSNIYKLLSFYSIQQLNKGHIHVDTTCTKMIAVEYIQLGTLVWLFIYG